MATKPLLIVAAIGGTAVAAAIGVNVFQWQDEVAPAQTDERAAARAAAETATQTAARIAAETSAQTSAKDGGPKTSSQVRPSFDVVRVDPSGDAVMAGRALPGSTVIILDNGKPIGEVTADNRGEWVFVPTKPLTAGNRELTLTMRLADGKTVQSDDIVVLAVPGPGKDVAGGKTKGLSGALVLKTPRSGGPSTLMQRPSGKASLALSVETVDYDDQGRLVISGRAKLGSWVNVYLNNVMIGRAKAGLGGIWRLSPETNVKPGLYTLRCDQVDAANKVTARVTMPFSRADPVAEPPPEPFVIVQPGNSLWRLARRTYGEGTRYTVIFRANKEQITDPDLIYPGQVLALPVTN